MTGEDRNLDDRLEARRGHLETRRRIESRGADCLTFARLAEEVLDQKEVKHLQHCDRCGTLRERLRTAAAASHALEFTGSRNRAMCPRSALWLVSPVICAACLVLSVWLIGSRAQHPGSHLRTEILRSAELLDASLRVLGDRPRDTTDVEHLREENQALRQELRGLITHFEQLLDMARQEQATSTGD